MKCSECGGEIEDYFNILLCNRCLKAQNWDKLKADDYVLLRRDTETGRITIAHGVGGERWTNLSYLGLDPMVETHRAVSDFLERIPA